MPGKADAVVTASGYSAVIRRTSYGVPHITAPDLGSAAFGQGWAYAEDRLCDLADQVVKVRGQRARWFGAGDGNVNIATDLAYRQLDLVGLAQQQLARLSTEETQVLNGYVAGFNGFLAHVGVAHAPGFCAGQPWVGPITNVDVLAYQRDIALLASGQNFLGAMAAAQPPAAAASTPKIAPSLVKGGVDNALADVAGAGSAGSNGWALGANKSSAGKGELIANPHFPWQGELRFWESQLTVPGKLNVYGGSLGGLPGVQIGFTDKVAWTHTIATGTRFTFYSVNLVPGSPTTYYVDGHPEAMTAKTITIQVNNGSGGLTNLTQTQYSSRYGPMLDLSAIDPSLGWSTASAMTYRDANIDNDRMLRQWLNIARATDVNGIKAAINSDQGIPWVNTIATDSSGNAWYADPSQTPALSPSATAEWLATQPLGILDGSDSSNAWQTIPGARSPGLIPFSQQPQLLRRDYVFNANDSHWLANTQQLLTGFSPLQGPEVSPVTVRTRENVHLIESDPSFTLADLGNTILSDTSFTSEQLTSYLVAACQARGASPVVVDGQSVNLTSGCSALAAWDRKFDVGSSGAVLWRETIASVIAAYPDALTVAGPLFGVAFNPADPGHTPRGAPYSSTPLLQGMARAVLRLRGLGLAPNVKLQNVQYTIKNGVRIPVPGGNENVGIANAVYYSPAPGSTREPVIPGGTPLPGTDMTTAGYVVNYGTSFLATVQYTSSGVQARGLLTFGESADPASPHFSDQTNLFTTKTLRDLKFTDSAINTDPNLSVEVLLQFGY
jgi:acyl-homoserine-lactone acylase